MTHECWRNAGIRAALQIIPLADLAGDQGHYSAYSTATTE
jgi:hypothetical protein